MTENYLNIINNIQKKKILCIGDIILDHYINNELIKISEECSEEFLIFSGDDASFLNLLSSGGHGVISVAANIIPNIISEICNEYKDNLEHAKDINERYQKFYDLLFIESNPSPVKWMLYKMNLIENSIRLPLLELDEKYHKNILSEMLKLKIL